MGYPQTQRQRARARPIAGILPAVFVIGRGVKNIYLIGICGTGVGALAGLLKSQGYHVRGSDEHVYPPMSTQLTAWGIEVLSGFDAQHLQPHPDLVIVGNVIRAANPEAVYTRTAGLATMSMPQAVATFGIGDKHSIVMAGTHGKTTTTALAAHILMHAGIDPSYLVGGALVGYPESFHHGVGPYFVIEGDEYDTAYFDKGPKFLHYRAKTAVITSLEFDHADIFPDIAAVDHAFAKLIETVPADGHLVVWQGAERAVALIAKHNRAEEVTLYATKQGRGTTMWLSHYASGPQGLTFEPMVDGKSLGAMQVPLWGEFSACNVLAVLGALKRVDLAPEVLRAGFASFAGVRRRMEVRAEVGGVTVVDDFAHHPTAVAKTLEAARTRWPKRRLWAIFEPRSATSRRNVFQDAYTEAFTLADRVVISGHPRLQEVPQGDRFSPDKLAASLCARHTDATFCDHTPSIAKLVVDEACQGDVVMILSNGDFAGLHGLVIQGLQQKKAT